MPVIHTGKLLREAMAGGVGLAAFNVINLEHGEAIVEAAEETGLPAVLQVSENCVKFHRGQVRPLLAGLAAMAEASDARVSCTWTISKSFSFSSKQWERGSPQPCLMHQSSPSRKTLPLPAERFPLPEPKAGILKPNWARSGGKTVRMPPASGPIRRKRRPSSGPPASTLLLLPWGAHMR